MALNRKKYSHNDVGHSRECKLSNQGMSYDGYHLSINTSDIPEFIEYLSHRPFQKMNFSFAERDIYYLAPQLLQHKQLTNLSFFNPYLYEPFFERDQQELSQREEKYTQAIAQGLQTTKLQSLSFPAVYPATLPKLTAAIKTNTSLTSVSFMIHEKDEHIAISAIVNDIIQNNPRIKSLTLHARKGSFQKDSLELLFKSLEHAPLEKLKLFDINPQLLNDDLLRLLVDVTNKREAPIRLAFYYNTGFSYSAVNILKESKNIIGIETNGLPFGSEFLLSHFKANAERHAKQKQAQVPDSKSAVSSSSVGSNLSALFASPFDKDQSEVATPPKSTPAAPSFK